MHRPDRVEQQQPRPETRTEGSLLSSETTARFAEPRTVRQIKTHRSVRALR
jgi:hypothetical protein